jgi:hypothetical protein
VATIDLLIQQIEALIPANLRYQAGKGGLRVLPAEGGVYLVNLTAQATQNAVITGLGDLKRDMSGRNFTAAQRDWIENVLALHFPQFDFHALLARSVDTGRRLQGLGARLGYARGQQTQGAVDMLESLDHERPNLGTMNPKDTTTIPRAATWVRKEPAPPTRYIVQVEFSLEGGKIRPDEVLIAYEISKEELDYLAINKGAKFLDIPANLKKARNLNVICYDINRELRATSLEAHFSKTLEGLRATVDYLVSLPPHGWGLLPEGRATFRAKDSYLGNVAARFEEAAGKATDVKMVRESERGTMAYVSAIFEQQADATGKKVFQQVIEERHSNLPAVLEAMKKGNIAAKARQVIDDLGQILKKL